MDPGLVPKHTWQTTNNSDGALSEHADVIEITDLLDLARWRQSCPGMGVIVRRELPHPDATLDAFKIRDGSRYQGLTTNTPWDGSRSSKPATAPTPALRASSGPESKPASDTCPLGTRTSTRSGSSPR